MNEINEIIPHLYISNLDSSLLVGETNQAYINNNPDFTHKYYWVITTHLGCMQKTYLRVPTKVNNIDTGGITEVLLSPNPSNGYFDMNVLSDVNENGVMTITNIVGAKLLEQPFFTNDKMHVALSQPSGIYLITLRTAHGRYSCKMVISN